MARAMESVYLEAIQKIPGTVPGEKYKKLNLMARSVIAAKSGEKDASHPEAKRRKIDQQLTEVPEILQPLVDLEVAKQLRQPEVIVEALKSEDPVLFNRALKAKWFFDGTCKNFTNVDYFMSNIMPYISVHRRYHVLKALSKNLTSKNPELAEEFYNAIAAMYSEKQAEPLFMACSDSFILNKLPSLKLYLSTKELKQLLQKNPSAFVNYFKQHDSISNYKDSHLLIRQHAADFVTLITSRHWQPVSSSHTKALVQSGVDLTSLPIEFLNSLSLKMLTKKLIKSQYQSLVEKKLFPDPKKLKTEFSLEDILSFLKHYPKKENYEFIFRCFEKLYGKSILEYDKFITSDMLINISPELRVKYARRQQELQQNSWKFKRSIEKFWRCYLPIAETIPAFKSQIEMSADPDDRRFLSEALIFICDINSDKETLLNVLEFLATNHKNERESVIVPILRRLESFDLSTLTAQHWKYIATFEEKFPDSLIVSKIRFHLINGLEIDALIDLYMKKTSQPGSWNILCDKPHYERQCLEKFIEKLLNGRDENREYWDRNRIIICCDIARAIWYFNARNLDANIQLMSVKNYPIVKSTIEETLFQNQSFFMWSHDDLKRALASGEPDLYHEYYPEKEDSTLTEREKLIKTLKILKKNPGEMMENWKTFFMYTQNFPSRARNYFFTQSLWYQDLPRKFFGKCLEDIAANKLRGKLAAPLLLDGLAIEKAAIADCESKKNIFWDLITSPRSFHLLKPQPSLDTLLIYYKKHEREAAVFFTNICECMPANKAQMCALELLNNPKVSVNKQALQILRKITTNLQISELISGLQKSQQHKSIRHLIYTYTKNLLIKYETESSWLMWNECIDTITINDREIIKDLVFSKRFPKKYMLGFVKKLFATYKHLDSIKKPEEYILDDVNFMENYTNNLLHALTFINPNDLLDEYHNEILQTYFVKFDGSIKLWKIMEKYALNYLKNDNEIIKSRLDFVNNLILPIFKNYWNISHSEDKNFYPTNSLLNFYKQLFHREVLLKIETSQFIHDTLKLLTTVLSPLQMTSCYILLTIRSTIIFNKKAEIGEKLLAAISSLAEIFPDGLHVIAYFFYVTYGGNLENLFALLDILKSMNNDLAIKFVVSVVDIVYSMEPHSTTRNEAFYKIAQSFSKSENPSVIFRMNLILDDIRMNDKNNY